MKNMSEKTNKPAKSLSASAVARAFREESPEHDRLYRESEASAIIAQDMKLMRVRAGISQAELAKRIGKKQPFVARLEAGAYDRCEMSTLRTIMRALGRDFDFSKMTKALPEPVYNGASSCSDLETALEVDETYRRNIGEYSRVNWALKNGRKPPVVSIGTLKSQRGLGPAA